MWKPALVLVLVLSVNCSLWSSELSPGERRILEVEPAVVSVEIQCNMKMDILAKSFERSHTETGTGFLFRPDGYVITTTHVVADALVDSKDPALMERLRKEFVDSLKSPQGMRSIESQIGRNLTSQEKMALNTSRSNLSISKFTIKVIFSNRKAFDAEILAHSGSVEQLGKDIAVLKIPGNDLPAAPLGNSENISVQDAVTVIGYPALAASWGGGSASSHLTTDSGLEPTVTKGHITALKGGPFGPLIQSDVTIAWGNSGSPAFNDRGEVIGVVTFAAAEEQGFTFLVPVNTATEVVRQAGALPESGIFNDHWSKALNFYDEGQCHYAVAEFDNVLQLMPGLPEAQRYRRAALVCADKMGWLQVLVEKIGKLPAYGITGLFILSAAVFVVWRILTKSKSPPQSTAATVVGERGSEIPKTLEATGVTSVSGVVGGRARKIYHSNSKGRALLPAWIFGALLVLFFMSIIWFKPREQFDPAQQKLLRILAAVFVGLISGFFTGSLKLKGKVPGLNDVQIGAIGGFAGFALAFFLW